MANEKKSKVSILTNLASSKKPVLRLVLGTLFLPRRYHGCFQRTGHGCGLHLRAGLLQHPDPLLRNVIPARSICPATSSSSRASLPSCRW